MRVETLNHEDAAVRERVFAFLAPHESFGLFILGNLNTHFPGTHLRVEADALRVVLEIDGRIVATAATNGIGIRAFQILGVVTDPACRRRGYARAVCTALIRHMHRLGARHCVLFTDVPNTGAQRCYEGIGFQVTGDFVVAKLGGGAAA